MKKIASFEVDHTTLQPGMYLSRTDGGVVTYDLRFIRPNTPPFLPPAVLHTVEHIFATYARNSRFGPHIVYFGPMGCRTGFYLLTQGMPHEDAIELTRAALRFIAEYEGEVPGATAAECGNYREQDLPGAKAAAARMLPVLEDWTPADLSYEKGEKNGLQAFFRADA